MISQPQKCCHTQLQRDDPVLGNCCCWGVSILGKENGYQGFLSLSDCWIFVWKMKFPSFQFPAPLLLRCFQTCSWWKLFSFGSLLYFLLLNFIAPAVIYVHGRFGASLISLERKVWETRQGGSQWQHREAKWSFLSFTNVCSHFCSGSYQPEQQPRTRLLTPQSHGERYSSWLTPKLRHFGFNPGHLFIDLWEAQLDEVLRGFLPCKGSTNKTHITNRWPFNSFPTNNRKFSCLS